jgi:transcription antitermination factor NusA-like protein
MADSFARRVRPIIEAFQQQGVSLCQIARELNKINIKTARGKEWTATAVRNAMARFE